MLAEQVQTLQQALGAAPAQRGLPFPAQAFESSRPLLLLCLPLLSDKASDTVSRFSDCRQGARHGPSGRIWCGGPLSPVSRPSVCAFWQHC